MSDERRRLWPYPLLVGLSLLFCEVFLQILARVSLPVARILAAPGEAVQPIIPDERLVFRGNPLYPGHDAAGFRNDRRPSHADIVTLGDSQTYGMGVREGWPREVARATGLTLYNMAFPGYGAANNLLQLDEALSREPDHLLVAPYFGNDLYDCFRLAKRHPQLFASVPAELKDEADALERQRPVEMDFERLDSLFFRPTASRDPNPAPPPHLSIRRWLSQKSELHALLRATRRRLFPSHRSSTAATSDPLLSGSFRDAAAALSESQREYATPFGGGDWQTILSAGYRHAVLDDSDPRIRVGFVIMLAALDSIHAVAQERGVHMLVVIIPTKEAVFSTRVPVTEAGGDLDRMVADEVRLRQELITHLERSGIEYIDTLEALRESPEQPYPGNFDGHLNAVGHHVVAQIVARRLRSLATAN